MVFHSLWGWEKRYFVLPGSFLNFPPRAPPGTAVPRTPAFQRNRAIEFSPRHARKEESGRGHPAPRKGAAAPLTPASGEHSIALPLFYSSRLRAHKGKGPLRGPRGQKTIYYQVVTQIIAAADWLIATVRSATPRSTCSWKPSASLLCCASTVTCVPGVNPFSCR